VLLQASPKQIKDGDDHSAMIASPFLGIHIHTSKQQAHTHNYILYTIYNDIREYIKTKWLLGIGRKKWWRRQEAIMVGLGCTGLDWTVGIKP
jgi:hypothetical protein